MDTSTDNRYSLWIENATIRGGFTIVPNYILDSERISRDAQILYIHLLKYAWQKDSCFPGYDRLCGDLRCGRNQLSRFLKELQSANFLLIIRRGQGKTNIYVLRDFEKYQSDTSGRIASVRPVVDPVILEEYSGKEYSDEERERTALAHEIADRLRIPGERGRILSRLKKCDEAGKLDVKKAQRALNALRGNDSEPDFWRLVEEI